MIHSPEELDRIVKAQLASWEANKGVLVVKKASPLRVSRLNWLAKMKLKIKNTKGK